MLQSLMMTYPLRGAYAVSCDSIPDFSDCGEASCCTVAVPDTCPPAALAESNTGSIVCSTSCDDTTCSGDTWQEAISVDDEGKSRVLEPFKSGNPNKRGACWLWIPAGCIGDSTCGFTYTLTIQKLNEEDHSSPVVKALDEAVSSLLTITLVELQGMLFWKYTIATRKVVDIINEYADTLTQKDFTALSTGGEFLMTWGYRVTAFNDVSTPIALPGGVKKNSDGEVCFYADSWNDARPFSYKNKTMLSTDCVYNCNSAFSTRGGSSPWWCTATATIAIFAFFFATNGEEKWHV